MAEKKFLLMITKVKNESDIIESFIRYHSCIFDKIVVIENGSIDGTYEILKELKKEGLCIEIINEAAQDFDAYRYANQYTAQYVRETNADYVIFMDADEFLISSDYSNPRQIIESLNENIIYYLHWKTYLYDNKEEKKDFVPSNFCIYREEAKETFTKIIVPGKLYLRKKLVIIEGNHDFRCEEKIETEFLHSLKFAHFPIRSKVQYTKQILLNVIGLMCIPNENLQTGPHWKKMYQVSEDCNDLYQKSLHYSLYEGNDVSSDEVQDVFDIGAQIQYYEFAKNDLQNIFLTYLEIQALKLKAERLKVKWMNSECQKEKILIYGVGELCNFRVGRIDDSKYEIVAFVDSNPEKQFMVYNNKIVVTPEKMRFFPFAKIIIASSKYESEIRERIFEELPMLSDEDVISIDRFIVNQYQTYQT